MLTQTTVIINSPIKEVWAFFKNPDTLKLCLGGLQRLEHISGGKGTNSWLRKNIAGNKKENKEKETLIDKVVHLLSYDLISDHN